jgi:hypothetical protein
MEAAAMPILRRAWFPSRLARVRTLVLFALVAAGCRGDQTSGTVTGTVRYKGEPLSGGKVTFFGTNDQVATAMIGADGSYKAQKVPLGTVVAAVSTPGPMPGKEDAASNPMMKRKKVAPPEKKSVVVPDKYSDPKKSGVTLTVTGGTQSFDINLD